MPNASGEAPICIPRSAFRIRMNLPNKLTVSRFVLTVAFVAAMVSEVRWHETVSLVLYVAAALTDLFDGMIARRRKLVTNFGILMDPLADKILVCAAFITFVDRDWVPAWMAIMIVARELAITGLRLLSAAKNVVLGADSGGKLKTTWQNIAIISTLIWASYGGWGDWGTAVFGLTVLGYAWSWLFIKMALWMAILTTIYSGGAYLWRNRGVYMQDM